MNCRFCNNKLDKPFLNIGKSALANSFNKKIDLNKKIRIIDL